MELYTMHVHGNPFPLRKITTRAYIAKPAISRRRAIGGALAILIRLGSRPRISHGFRACPHITRQRAGPPFPLPAPRGGALPICVRAAHRPTRLL